MKITLTDLGLSVGARPLIQNLALDIPSGALVVIVGPNGSGKSTLLRGIYRALQPAAGTVEIGDTNVWAAGPRQSARLRAVVTQHQTSTEGLRVTDVIATGRHSHRRWFERDTADDRRSIQNALVECGILHLADRDYGTLSGGERQRVLIARALAQEAPVILLDEPTNHLDPGSQLMVMELLARLDLTRVVVLHDLDHAIAYAELLAVMHQGQLRAFGTPTEIFHPELAADVFGVAATTIPHPLTGRPHVVIAPLSTESTTPATTTRL